MIQKLTGSQQWDALVEHETRGQENEHQEVAADAVRLTAQVLEHAVITRAVAHATCVDRGVAVGLINTRDLSLQRVPRHT